MWATSKLRSPTDSRFSNSEGSACSIGGADDLRTVAVQQQFSWIPMVAES